MQEKIQMLRTHCPLVTVMGHKAMQLMQFCVMEKILGVVMSPLQPARTWGLLEFPPEGMDESPEFSGLSETTQLRRSAIRTCLAQQAGRRREKTREEGLGGGQEMYMETAAGSQDRECEGKWKPTKLSYLLTAI